MHILKLPRHKINYSYLLQFVSGIVLLWTLALISLDRHRCIVVPPYQSKMSPNGAGAYSIITWILASLIFMPVAFWFREQHSYNDHVFCTLVFPKSEAINYSLCFVIPLLMFACILPMAMLVYYYHSIFRKIISTKSSWATSCVVLSTVEVKNCNRKEMRRQSELSLSDIFVPWPRKFSAGSQFSSATNGRAGSLSQQEEIRFNKHIKVVRLLFLNVVVVLFMWLPITIVMFLIYWDGRRQTDDKNFFLSSQYFLIALQIANFNTLINPVLYGLLSDTFRASLLKLWCSRAKNTNGTQNKTVTPSSGRNHGSCRGRRKPSYINSVSESPNEVI